VLVGVEAQVDIERDPQLQTEKVTPELIEYIVQKIVARFDPYQIILFGSRARSDARSDSDLDLFIVQSGTGANRQMRRDIDRLLAGRRFGVDIIVRKPQEVQLNIQDKNPFYLYHLFRDGRVLYERAD
jgi:predicted nucleotidyltransferase